jgi:hypothetical protein
LRSAAGGRNDRIANGASRSRAGNEETDSKYAKGIRKNKYPSSRQHKREQAGQAGNYRINAGLSGKYLKSIPIFIRFLYFTFLNKHHYGLYAIGV